MKNNAIAIIRVSTALQDCERQRRDVQQAARVHGLNIVRTLELPDLSGTKMLRHPEVQRVLESLSKPGVDGCVVSAIDRLIRPGELGDLAIFDAFQRSKKLIWTPGQVLDVSTQSGFLMSGVMGIMSGVERMILLQRTAAGKETARLRGDNPCGTVVLPRGLTYSKAKGWSYEEPDASRIRLAYDLFFERKGWQEIATRVGGGWSHNGIWHALRNPVWKGVRRYTKNRSEPLEVPLRGITEPLISPERWDAAQKLIAEKTTRWRAKKKSPHFLLSGLVMCGECSKPFYPKMGGHDCYFCSSGFPGRGPRCGQRSVQKVATEQVVTEFVTGQLLDVSFLRDAIERIKSAEPARVDNADKAARERAKLEAERQRLLRLVLKGMASEEDFARESKRIDAELREVDLLMPAPVANTFEPGKLATSVSRAFARFGKRSFEERRTTLQDVCRAITIQDGSIPAITLNGAFLDRVNGAPPLTRSLLINAVSPDVVIQLPQPVLIPTVDRRRRNAA